MAPWDILAAPALSRMANHSSQVLPLPALTASSLTPVVFTVAVFALVAMLISIVGRAASLTGPGLVVGLAARLLGELPLDRIALGRLEQAMDAEEGVAHASRAQAVA